MGYDGSLAYTGVALNLFGMQVGLGWLIGIGITLIIGGALIYRYGRRITSGKK